MLQPLPSALAVLCECFLEAGRGLDRKVIPMTRLLVTNPIQRRHYALVELGALVQNGLRRLKARIFKLGHTRNRINISDMAHVKEHVLRRGFVGHRILQSVSYSFFYLHRAVRRCIETEKGADKQRLGASLKGLWLARERRRTSPLPIHSQPPRK